MLGLKLGKLQKFDFVEEQLGDYDYDSIYRWTGKVLKMQFLRQALIDDSVASIDCITKTQDIQKFANDLTLGELLTMYQEASAMIKKQGDAAKADYPITYLFDGDDKLANFQLEYNDTDRGKDYERLLEPIASLCKLYCKLFGRNFSSIYDKTIAKWDKSLQEKTIKMRELGVNLCDGTPVETKKSKTVTFNYFLQNIKFSNNFVPLFDFCLITGRFAVAKDIMSKFATTTGGIICASLTATLVLQ